MASSCRAHIKQSKNPPCYGEGFAFDDFDQALGNLLRLSRLDRGNREGVALLGALDADLQLIVLGKISGGQGVALGIKGPHLLAADDGVSAVLPALERAGLVMLGGGLF